MPDALPLPALLADLRAKAERAKELRPGEADDDWWAPGLIIAHADARAALRESLSPDVVLRLVSAIETARNDALDEAAEILADVVNEHRSGQSEADVRVCGSDKDYCEDFGCFDLAKAADAILALKGPR